MYLRKTSNLKAEVSFDEPLNTDWDGNELLLSDILGTEGDLVVKPIEDDVDRQLLSSALDKLSERERLISPSASGWGARQSAHRKRWPTGWASPSPTSPAWRSGSSPGSKKRS